MRTKVLYLYNVVTDTLFNLEKVWDFVGVQFHQDDILQYLYKNPSQIDNLCEMVIRCDKELIKYFKIKGGL